MEAVEKSPFSSSDEELEAIKDTPRKKRSQTRPSYVEKSTGKGRGLEESTGTGRGLEKSTGKGRGLEEFSPKSLT